MRSLARIGRDPGCVRTTWSRSHSSSSGAASSSRRTVSLTALSWEATRSHGMRSGPGSPRVTRPCDRGDPAAEPPAEPAPSACGPTRSAATGGTSVGDRQLDVVDLADRLAVHVDDLAVQQVRSRSSRSASLSLPIPVTIISGIAATAATTMTTR